MTGLNTWDTLYIIVTKNQGLYHLSNGAYIFGTSLGSAAYYSIIQPYYPFYHIIKNIHIYAEFAEFATVSVINRSPLSDISKPLLYGIWFYKFHYISRGDPNARLANLTETQFMEHYCTNERFHIEVLGEYMPNSVEAAAAFFC